MVPVRCYRGFSKNESGIFDLLSVRGVHPVDQIRAHLDALSGYQDRVSIISVRIMLCRLRAKLRRLAPSVTIETNGHDGYSMTAESIAAVAGLPLV